MWKSTKMLRELGRRADELGESAAQFAGILKSAKDRKDASHGIVMKSMADIYKAAQVHRDNLASSLKSADEFIDILNSVGEVLKTQHGADAQAYDALIGPQTPEEQAHQEIQQVKSGDGQDLQQTEKAA